MSHIGINILYYIILYYIRIVSHRIACIVYRIVYHIVSYIVSYIIYRIIYHIIYRIIYHTYVIYSIIYHIVSYITYCIISYITSRHVILCYISRQVYCLIQSCMNSTDKASPLNTLTSLSAQNDEWNIAAGSGVRKCCQYDAATARSRVHLVKRTFRRLLKTFPEFYGLRVFISVSTRAIHWPHREPDKSDPQSPILFFKLHFNIILPSVRSIFSHWVYAPKRCI